MKLFNSKQLNLYVLRLVNDKYYVGSTFENVHLRIKQHSQGLGAKWTKLYKPIEILEIFKTYNRFDEDKYTKMYMSEFGIENVRGGSYTKINLDNYQIQALKLELKTANNQCFKCGKYGHYASECDNL